MMLFLSPDTAAPSSPPPLSLMVERLRLVRERWGHSWGPSSQPAQPPIHPSVPQLASVVSTELSFPKSGSGLTFT